MTIANWEDNESQPALRYVPAIIRFLGYDPHRNATSFLKRLIAPRKAQGVSQRQMAERLRVDPGTLHGWEVGQHQPIRKRQNLILESLQLQ